jgi:hypothetical protein
MRRILFTLGLVAALLTACADPSTPGGGSSVSPTSSDGTTSASPAPSESSPRLAVYETLIRYLVDPEGSQPIYVLSDLCFQLMKSDDVNCPEHLSSEEQQELTVRLQDLGDIVFRSHDDPGPSPDEVFQEILLGPIVEKPDGLRVEGGSVCGGLCGTGSVYVLEATEDGYQVTGKDDQYGTWIA